MRNRHEKIATLFLVVLLGAGLLCLPHRAVASAKLSAPVPTLAAVTKKSNWTTDTIFAGDFCRGATCMSTSGETLATVTGRGTTSPYSVTLTGGLTAATATINSNGTASGGVYVTGYGSSTMVINNYGLSTLDVGLSVANSRGIAVNVISNGVAYRGVGGNGTVFVCGTGSGTGGSEGANGVCADVRTTNGALFQGYYGGNGHNAVGITADNGNNPYSALSVTHTGGLGGLIVGNNGSTNTVFITRDGGYGTTLGNVSTSTLKIGTVVALSSSNYGFASATASSTAAIGVVVRTNCTSGTNCLVITKGIVDVLMDPFGVGCTIGYPVYTGGIGSEGTGNADNSTEPILIANYMQMIGRALETKAYSNGATCKVLLK